MRLKLDENLGRSVLQVFEQAMHDVIAVRDQRLSGAADRDLIAVCEQEQRCLVTLDLDFSNPFQFRPSAYAGIAVLRLPSKPSHSDLLEAARTLVEGLARRDIKGKLWMVQKGRIREHQEEASGLGELSS